MGADFQVIFYLHHKNMLYEINTIDRRKGSFVWLYSFNVGGSLGRTNWQFVTQQLAQSGQGHLRVGRALLVSTVMKTNVDNVLHSSAARCYLVLVYCTSSVIYNAVRICLLCCA